MCFVARCRAVARGYYYALVFASVIRKVETELHAVQDCNLIYQGSMQAYAWLNEPKMRGKRFEIRKNSEARLLNSGCRPLACSCPHKSLLINMW